MAKKPAAKRSLPVRRDAGAKAKHVVDHAAILRIARHFPRLRWLAAIADLPSLRPVSSLACTLIAASRIYWLKAIVIVFFCAGLVLSSRLWIGPRVYPVAPLFDWLPASPHPLDLVAFVGLFALAPAILLAPRPQRFIVAFLALIAVFCLLDQTRWQPRVFQYSSLLGALAFFSWDSEDVRGRRRALNIARLIVATTYIFSGLQKANLNFIHNDFLWFVEPITGIVPAARGPLSVVATAAPLIQVGFGIGLLTTRYRGIALVLAVSMAIEDINVTPYPEPRVYRKIARSLCDRSPYRQDFVLLVREQRMFFSKPETGYRCSQL